MAEEHRREVLEEAHHTGREGDHPVEYQSVSKYPSIANFCAAPDEHIHHSPVPGYIVVVHMVKTVAAHMAAVVAHKAVEAGHKAVAVDHTVVGAGHTVVAEVVAHKAVVSVHAQRLLTDRPVGWMPEEEVAAACCSHPVAGQRATAAPVRKAIAELVQKATAEEVKNSLGTVVRATAVCRR